MGIKKHDQLSILITFVVGAFVGGYLYITNFAGFAAKIETPDIEKVSEFTIVGDVYGGCRSACPSFQIVNNDSYRYLYTPAPGADQVIREGNLPAPLRRSLRNALTETSLSQQSQIIQPAVCNSFTDGIDVKYEITIDGNQYTLDSCGTSVDGESQLWTTLGSVWDYYETSSSN